MAYNDVCRGMGVLEFRYVASDLNVARTVGVVNEIRRSLAYGENGSDSCSGRWAGALLPLELAH